MINGQVAGRAGVTLVARATVPVLATPARSTRALRRCHSRVLYSALCRLRFDCRACEVQRLPDRLVTTPQTVHSFGGPVGLLVALVFVSAAVRSRHALAPLAGLLIGLGSISLALITVANASCSTVVTPTSYSSCTAPDLIVWTILAGAAVLAGALPSIAAIRRT